MVFIMYAKLQYVRHTRWFRVQPTMSSIRPRLSVCSNSQRWSNFLRSTTASIFQYFKLPLSITGISVQAHRYQMDIYFSETFNR